MPSVPLYPPPQTNTPPSPLPPLLRTPGGLAIIEIQGTLKTQFPITAADGPIGELTFPFYDADKPADDPAWQKRVHLQIGPYQLLTGEVKKLVKPFAVVGRRRRVSKADALADSVSDLADTSAETGTNPTARSDELEIFDVIYYKFIFSHRPEPIGAGALLAASNQNSQRTTLLTKPE